MEGRKVRRKKEVKWEDRSEDAIAANISHRCSSCKYRGTLGGGKLFCNYIFIKKRMRRSDPFNCKRYEKGEITREDSVLDYETAEEVEEIETVENME